MFIPLINLLMFLQRIQNQVQWERMYNWRTKFLYRAEACSFQQTPEFNECQVLLKWESSRCNQIRKNGHSTPEKESRSERKQACKPQYIPHAGKKTLTNLYKMWKNIFWKRFEFSKNFTLRRAAQKFANFYSQDFLRFLEHPKFTGELRCQERQVYLKKLEVPTNLGKNQCFSQTQLTVHSFGGYSYSAIMRENNRWQWVAKDGTWVEYKDNRWVATRISGWKTRFSVRFSSVDKFFLISDY